MNILTKISIVVLVVLVLLASAVFINLATVGPNYREAYKSEKVATNTAVMMANQKELAVQRANNEIKSLTDERNGLANDKAAVQQKMDALLAASETKVLELARANRSADRKIDLLLAESASNNSRADLFYKQLDDTRKDFVRLEAEFRDLSQRYQTTAAALQRQEKMVASLSEDKADLIQQLESRRSAGTAAVNVSGAVGSAAAEYTGTITAVRDDTASVNIGSSNGVKQGDKLIIYRAGKFIAYLQIGHVENNVAAGVIRDKQADPVQGDKVSSKMSNGNL